jgi:N-acetyl-1-D-myo-inositol-2-amino-2-deoxy-alpha-D-glucopyranoside deacetylase
MATESGIGPQKIYWTAVPRSVLAAGIEAFAESTDNPFGGAKSIDDLPFGTPDERIAARIDGHEQHERKTAALRAHATQIPDTSWLYSIAGNFGAEFMGVEYYELAAGAKGPTGPYGLESDLFAGIPTD